MKKLNSLPIEELIPAKPAVRSKRTQAQTIGHWSRKRRTEKEKHEKPWKRENGDGQTYKWRQFPHEGSTPSVKGVI